MLECGSLVWSACRTLARCLFERIESAFCSGQEGLRFSGPAICFDCEEDMVHTVVHNSEKCEGKVIIIRYEGPKGGPGMPEMLSPTSVIKSAGLGKHWKVSRMHPIQNSSHHELPKLLVVVSFEVEKSQNWRWKPV